MESEVAHEPQGLYLMENIGIRYPVGSFRARMESLVNLCDHLTSSQIVCSSLSGAELDHKLQVFA